MLKYLTQSNILAVLLFILTNQFSVAHAWNNVGHRWIADIAWNRMTPKAQNMAFTLLTSGVDSQTCDARIFANPTNPEDVFVGAATWLDCSRGADKIPVYESYVHADRYPLCPAMPPPQSYPASDELKKAMADLVNPKNTIQLRRESLKVIIHLVGDLHQPLHTATTLDHLGGGTMVIPGSQEVPTNLHAYWDSNVVAMAKADKATVNNLIKTQAAQMEQGTWNEWEQETIVEANQVAYKALLGSVMCNKPSGTPITITPQYASEATRLGELKIAQAGIRLALILNLASMGRVQQ